MTTFQPLRDLILVDPIKPNVATSTGLIIASDEHVRPVKGTVLAVGPGTWEKGVLVPVTVKVGDVIMFVKGSLEKYKVDGQEFCVVSAKQLIGVDQP
jgi:chaperonin GroES